MFGEQQQEQEGILQPFPRHPNLSHAPGILGSESGSHQVGVPGGQVDLWPPLASQQVLPRARVATLAAIPCPARAHPERHTALNTLPHFALTLLQLSVDSKHVDTFVFVSLFKNS